MNENIVLHGHRTFLNRLFGKGSVTAFWQHTQYPKAVRKAIDKDVEKSVLKLVILSIVLYVILFLSPMGKFIIGIAPLYQQQATWSAAVLLRTRIPHPTWRGTR